MIDSTPRWVCRSLAHGFAVATFFVVPMLTHAQSGSSPFGAVSKGTINAISQWEKLPQAVRTDIITQMATLTEAQRVALLASVPALKTVDAAGINTILAVVAADIPLPGPAMAASHVPTTLTLAVAEPYLMQSFTIQKAGEWASLSLLMSDPRVGLPPLEPQWPGHVPVQTPRIEVRLYRGTGVMDATAGAPGWLNHNQTYTPVAWVYFPTESFSGAPTWMTGQLSTKVPVKVGEKYTIVIYAHTFHMQPGPTPARWHGTTGDVYTGGTGSTYGTWPAAAGDFSFKAILAQ